MKNGKRKGKKRRGRQPVIVVGPPSPSSKLRKLQDELLTLQDKAIRLPANEQIAIRIKIIQAEIRAIYGETRKPIMIKEVNPIFTEISWDNINFHDNSISILFCEHWLEKFPVPGSLESLNQIKNHYKFANAPNLKVEITNRRIKRILNAEVLFFYILFLTNSGQLFDKNLFGRIADFKKFTISYYRTHLPDVFKSRCFDFLSQRSIDNFPIVPVGEVVRTSKGQIIIHDSFLFPIKGKNEIFWIWESVKESKATYIFKTLVNYTVELQKLFDYLTGEIINKRQNLISSPNLQMNLNYIDRKIHENFDSWKSQIRAFQ